MRGRPARGGGALTWTSGNRAIPISPGAGPPPRRLLRGTQRLQHLVGRRLLVGVTVLDGAGVMLTRTQFCGPVLEVADGVVVVDKSGETALLPSDDLAYTAAPPGRYVLVGSGEVVVDPDYLTTWEVTAGVPHDRGHHDRGHAEA